MDTGSFTFRFTPAFVDELDLRRKGTGLTRSAYVVKSMNDYWEAQKQAEIEKAHLTKLAGLLNGVVKGDLSPDDFKVELKKI